MAEKEVAETLTLTPEIVQRWTSLQKEELVKELSAYNNDFSKRFYFKDVDIQTRKELLKFFNERLDTPSHEIDLKVLEMIRILARDKDNLDSLVNETICDFIFASAGLVQGDKEGSLNIKILMEAEKCLINLLHHSAFARDNFEKKATIGLLERLAGSKKENTIELKRLPSTLSENEKNEIWFFDLRISFITTAYLQALQTLWREDASAMNVFVETTEQGIDSHAVSSLNITDSSMNSSISRAGEAMKVLYNLICRCNGRDFPKTVDVDRLLTLSCKIICHGRTLGKDLVQHAVNLLTALPKGEKMCSIACPHVDASFQGPQFDGRDMTVPDFLVKILAEQLSVVNSSERELLNTYFAVLLPLCSECKEARRYCRLLILPPLTASDVARRPDEGDTLRNQMIRAIHSTVSRDLAADFLFLLCKRSVPRMIKYTGFGHAAGLFADQGLLGSISERKQGDSEDSETDEYKNIADDVNPVSGYIQPRTTNPLEGMSEEQKEHEAMKLVNAIDQMMRSGGGIRPATIGPDGRPREVSHVLELIKDANDNEDAESSDEN